MKNLIDSDQTLDDQIDLNFVNFIQNNDNNDLNLDNNNLTFEVSSSSSSIDNNNDRFCYLETSETLTRISKSYQVNTELISDDDNESMPGVTTCNETIPFSSSSTLPESFTFSPSRTLPSQATEDLVVNLLVIHDCQRKILKKIPKLQSSIHHYSASVCLLKILKELGVGESETSLKVDDKISKLSKLQFDLLISNFIQTVNSPDSADPDPNPKKISSTGPTIRDVDKSLIQMYLDLIAYNKLSIHKLIKTLEKQADRTPNSTQLSQAKLFNSIFSLVENYLLNIGLCLMDNLHLTIFNFH